MTPGPPCACGRVKDGRSSKCAECYQNRWTAEDDARLIAMYAAADPISRIAAELARSKNSIRCRARLKGLRLGRVVAERIRAEGRAAFWADPIRVARWKAKHRRASLSPRTLERLAESARHYNRLGTFRCTGHTEEARKKMSVTRLRKADERLSFAPRGHPLRKEYKWLVGEVGKNEALRIILDEIERLPAFEKQMLKVQAGASLVRKTATPSKAYGQTLGGVADMAA